MKKDADFKVSKKMDGKTITEIFINKGSGVQINFADGDIFFAPGGLIYFKKIRNGMWAPTDLTKVI